MKRYSPAILLLVCGAALILGVIQLFRIRFEAGDVYPAYSSLRADPLGTMALFESLETVQGITARRDFSTLNRLPDGADTVYLHLAASLDALKQPIPETVFKEIENFLMDGGRFVITLFPESTVPFFPPAPPPKLAPGEKPPEPSLLERWGIRSEIVNLVAGDDSIYQPAPVANVTKLPVPKILGWHSGIVLKDLNSAWTPVYLRNSEAVVIEREFGPGVAIVATDSFFLSNEAMLNDRHADLLAWLIGDKRTAVFDEAHLGVTESPGVASLIRKYRLHGFIGGLILLAALFIWKNAMSLVPLQASQVRPDFVGGRDAASGFVNLLRRSIPRQEVLAVCFAEWKKSGEAARYSGRRLQQAEAAFEAERARTPKERDDVRAYQTISNALKKQK